MTVWVVSDSKRRGWWRLFTNPEAAEKCRDHMNKTFKTERYTVSRLVADDSWGPE